MSVWDQRYAGDTYLFGEAPNAFLARQAFRLPKSGRALAVADGEGRNGVWLAQQGLAVDSIDSSAVAQAKARRLADKTGVALSLVQVDLASWTWPHANYDVVAAIFIQFADPALRRDIFAGMKRALKPGGLLLIEGYGEKQLDYRTGGPNRIENLYTAEQMRADFAAFEIQLLESYDASISEGSAHSGLSALVDLVARKPRA